MISEAILLQGLGLLSGISGCAHGGLGIEGPEELVRGPWSLLRARWRGLPQEGSVHMLEVQGEQEAHCFGFWRACETTQEVGPASLREGCRLLSPWSGN